MGVKRNVWGERIGECQEVGIVIIIINRREAGCVIAPLLESITEWLSFCLIAWSTLTRGELKCQHLSESHDRRAWAFTKNQLTWLLHAIISISIRKYAQSICLMYTVFDQSIRSSEGCHLPSAIRRLSFATNNAMYRTCSDGGGQRTALSDLYPNPDRSK